MVAEMLNLADYKNSTDGTLIDSTLNGDHQAFEFLFMRHRNQLYTSMFRVAKSADLTEELVQDSFVQAFLKLATFKKKAAFSSWLYRIAFNKYLGMKRCRSSAKSLDALEQNNHFEPVDPQDSPEQSYSRYEDRQRVIEALQGLEAKPRQILELREFEGLSYEEIGQKLRLKPGTVRSQLSRARWKLHQALTSDQLSTTSH